MKNEIKQSNILTTAKYDLNAYQLNFLMLVIKQMNKENPDDNIVEIDLKEFVSRSGINGNVYPYLKTTAAGLRSANIEYYDKLKNRYNITGFIDYCNFVPNTAFARVKVNDLISPFIVELVREFTVIDIGTFFVLKSKHSKRIYSFCRQFVSTGAFRISIEDFKKRLNLIGKYEKLAHLKSRVLNPAINEINANSALSVSYSLEKSGRKYEYVNISIKIKEGKQKQLIENETTINALKELGQSSWFIKNILLTCEPSEISQTIYDCRLSIRDKNISNPSAYVYRSFINKGVPKNKI